MAHVYFIGVYIFVSGITLVFIDHVEVFLTLHNFYLIVL